MLHDTCIVKGCLAVAIHQVQVHATVLCEELDGVEVAVDGGYVDRASAAVVRHVEVSALVHQLREQVLRVGRGYAVDHQGHDYVRDLLLLALIVDIQNGGNCLDDFVVLEGELLVFLLQFHVGHLSSQVCHHELLNLLVRVAFPEQVGQLREDALQRHIEG